MTTTKFHSGTAPEDRQAEIARRQLHSRPAPDPDARLFPAIQLPPPWMSQGACNNVANPDLFHPGPSGPTKAAKAICKRCPVVGECLEYALTNDAGRHGIWGGTTVHERDALRRTRKTAPAGAA